jgi:hypothetical protein
MRQLLLFFVACCVLGSCKAKKTIYSMSATNDSVNSPNVVHVTVNKTSGDDNDYVTLSVDGLPGYITCEISPTSEKPPFTATLTFSLSQLAPTDVSTWKSYTASLKAVSSSGITRDQNITFSCFPTDGGVAFDTKSFYSHEQCSPSGSDVRVIDVMSTGVNKIMLPDFYSTIMATY